MKVKYILAGLAAAMLSVSALYADGDIREYREILRMQESGMHGRSRHVLNEKAASERLSVEQAADPEGLALLSEIIMNVEGYDARLDKYVESNPHSVLIPQIYYRHALNTFEARDYQYAGALLSMLSPAQLERSQVDEYLFKKAYCDLENGDIDRALLRFIELEKRPISDYSAPARYSIAYIYYEKKAFFDAMGWFEKAAQDSRFAENSKYFIMECRFMLNDHQYVTRHGEKMYNEVSDERKPHLARIISESWLVLGNAAQARKYYDLTTDSTEEARSRADWFYSGSVLYAVGDYKGAIESYNNMEMRADSIGQVANYQLGYSYVQTKNKVAAIQAFKDASMSSFDQVISEDAYFNWAKLAFDINNDPSVFQDYIKRYSDREKDDKIYSYMAVAALHNHDYAGAVDAYGMIDELDDDMRGNYMKANYLRANQLISAGSYRLAIQCLKVAAYYSDKGSRFNQLSRFWIAESYYRNDQYQPARELYTELYNQSALYRQPESYLIPYNIAYCYYKEGNYDAARKWYSQYLDGSVVEYRKDALERIGDCYFVKKDYKSAAATYDLAVRDFYDVNDIYPYYQSALSHGLSGNNERKIKLLSGALDANPSARFYPEAVYELGRAYVLKEDDAKAEEVFHRLASSSRDTTYVAKAYIELGSLARNQSQFNEALGYYKTVVEEMPLSGYSEDALAAIESIYQTKNEPHEYLAYIESIGKGATKTADEKEKMIFNAAEQNYLSGNYQRALVSLQDYLDTYPAGKYAYNAEFYIADSYRQLGKYEQACDSYEKVIEGGSGSFVELAMLSFSELSYKLERWDDAFGAYSSLYASARFENNRLAALEGMMRSAFRGHKWAEAIKNADKVLFESRISDAVRREAEYVKAKAYMATSRRAEALSAMEKLAADCKDEYGAEAAYILIMDSYDKAEFAAVEDKVYAFADSGSPQSYWLAKSFIVLGDSFVDRGELAQAKATFESVRDGYTPSGDDDVMDNVRMRLEKLQEMMASVN
jgi:TolA-binding protein